MKTLLLLCAVALAAIGCSTSHTDDSQGQTHWLDACEEDSDCGELQCACGVCVAPCDGDACAVEGRETLCFPARSEAVESMCAPSDALPLCLEPCGGGCDDGQRCVDGACVLRDPPSGGAGGESGEGGAGGESGEGGAGGAGEGGSSGEGGQGGVAPGGAGGTGGVPSNDAGVSDGGVRPDFCELPPEIGDCDAAAPRYYYDPATDSCRLFTYGGCGGNENNFETASECGAICNAGRLPPTVCEVDGVRYPDGASNVPDPTSCNTCSCTEGGDVNACTDIACDEPCPEGTQRAASCVSCGPVDNCEVLRTGCLPECEEDADCENNFCFDGVCRILCG